MSTPFQTIGDAVPALHNLTPAAAAAPTSSQTPPPASAGAPPPPPSVGGAGANSTPRGFFVPRWLAWTFLAILLWVVIHGTVYYQNAGDSFEISNKLVHAGPWYRRASAAIADTMRDRTFEIRKDIWGRAYAVYRVGDRKFVQLRSREPAVEVQSPVQSPAKSK